LKVIVLAEDVIILYKFISKNLLAVQNQ